MEHEFVIKIGDSFLGLQIEDLHKLILICGPKTCLQIDLTYDQFFEMIGRSPSYNKDIDIFNLTKFTQMIETKLSKLF